MAADTTMITYDCMFRISASFKGCRPMQTLTMIYAGKILLMFRAYSNFVCIKKVMVL